MGGCWYAVRADASADRQRDRMGIVYSKCSYADHQNGQDLLLMKSFGVGVRRRVGALQLERGICPGRDDTTTDAPLIKASTECDSVEVRGTSVGLVTSKYFISYFCLFLLLYTSSFPIFIASHLPSVFSRHSAPITTYAKSYIHTTHYITMSGRLQGKVALVSGSTQGFGRGILETFVREGAVVLGMDLQATDGPVDGYTENQAYQIQANVAEETSWKKAVGVPYSAMSHNAALSVMYGRLC